jgi:prepilin signal peptidase PulO-like enzyme (type II secretory pathway)
MSTFTIPRRLSEDVAVLIAGSALAFAGFEGIAAVLVVIWLGLTLVIVRSDLDEFLIPDWATFGIAVIGVYHLVTMAPDGLDRYWLYEIAIPAVLRAVCTFVGFWLLALIYERVMGRPGLGFGDVKLCAALVLWLDSYSASIALELAALGALLVVIVEKCRRGDAWERTDVIPLGAFLAPSAWIVYVAMSFVGRFSIWY